MYIRVISDCKCRGQLGQISGKCTLGYYDTLAFSPRKSESATWCMLAANSGKLNASAKIRASHYRAGFALSAGTANWKFIFCVECHIFSDTVTYMYT